MRQDSHMSTAVQVIAGWWVLSLTCGITGGALAWRYRKHNPKEKP